MPGDKLPESDDPCRRQRWVIETFVDLAGTLVSDFDLFDLLSLLSARCLELLQAAQVGLLVAGDDNKLQVLASSDEAMHALELFEVQNAEGPCLDVYRTRQAVLNEPLGDDSRWPHFAPRARAAGYQTVHALPMRHNDTVIGVVNIFDHDVTMMADADVAVAQALADIATFAIFQYRALHRATELTDQLRHALRSRVVIEQAKGVLSGHLGIDVAAAFDVMRQYSRNRNRPMADVAEQIVLRGLGTDELLAGARQQRSRRTPGDGGDKSGS